MTWLLRCKMNGLNSCFENLLTVKTAIFLQQIFYLHWILKSDKRKAISPNSCVLLICLGSHARCGVLRVYNIRALQI